MMMYVSKYSCHQLLSSLPLTNANTHTIQFDTVSDVPKNYFTEQKSIYGRVERVIDGDTVRVRHCKSRYLCDDRQNQKRIYDSTLSIRLYGIDCPELQKRSTDPPSQPYAEEAKQFTSNLVLGKQVRVTLLRKDQYGRAVSKVETPRPLIPFLGRKDVSIELVDRGLATVYTGGGAEYSGNKELLDKKLSVAKRKKIGIWSQGSEMISPAEFKRQQKAALNYGGAAAK
jgi:endonuclease YncB( thermonuclease family)